MRRLAAVGLGLLLSACAGTREWYVVMPEADGRVGTVTVTRDGVETVLQGAYSSTRSGTGRVVEADPGEVQRTFDAALEATPVRPQAFLLFFREDSAELQRESRTALPDIAREILARPAPEITLVGHTDTTQSHAYNDALSRRRAETVRAQLVRLGVPAASIVIQGRGKREPLVPTPDNRREQRNRRVEVEVR